MGGGESLDDRCCERVVPGGGSTSNAASRRAAGFPLSGRGGSRPYAEKGGIACTNCAVRERKKCLVQLTEAAIEWAWKEIDGHACGSLFVLQDRADDAGQTAAVDVATHVHELQALVPQRREECREESVAGKLTEGLKSDWEGAGGVCMLNSEVAVPCD